ncbi:MAG: DUF59 domain-containing protein [Nanoarchaeota archaeon]|nr:DUF59 domain-containing protein [Nanoarchaeota archaeon]
MKNKIITKLKKIIDPHIGVNIYDLGLVKKITIKDDSAEVLFKPTSPYCPMISYFITEIEKAVKSVKGINKVKIKIEK